MIKYKIRNGIFASDAKITSVEVVRETEQSVFLKNGDKERREAKISQYESYYDTWELAHAALTQIADLRLAQSRRLLQDAQGFAGNVKGLKPN